ncbi:MAG: glycosyl transferase family 2, partial [Cytophagales bacterium]|nr:glycosyl transferase family 2 [Cytophagales bacterium]
MNTTRAWWPLSEGFHHYLARCSYLLQQGLFVADVAYYYGDHAPNFASPAPLIAGLPEGYDFDVVNSEVILEKMSVKNGRLYLPQGQSYAMLVLPQGEWRVSLPVLKKVQKLIEQGATVLGNKPTSVYGLRQWREQEEELNG